MKNIKYVLTLILFTACASPEISNLHKGQFRYKKLAADANILSVSVSRLPISEKAEVKSKPTMFLDMRDSLPHHYMKYLSDKISNADSYIEKLAIPILPASDVKKNLETDFTKLNIQFVFSNLKKYYNDKRFMHPNTRLEFLTTNLTLPANSSAVFYNINRLENEFDVIDLGSITRDQSVGLNAKLGISGGLGGGYENNSGNKSISTNNKENNIGNSVYDENGNLIGAINNKGVFSSVNEGNSSNKSNAEAKISAALDGAYQNSETIKESVLIKLNRLRTGFNFSYRSFTLAQRGRLSGDISDNIYVTATLNVANPNNVLSLKVYTVDNLFDKENNPNLADSLNFTSRLTNFVPCNNADNIIFNFNYEGAIRAVRNNWPSFGTNALEYDDRVTYFKIDTLPSEQLIVNKNEYCKDAHKFIAETADGSKYTLWIEDRKERELYIMQIDGSDLFEKWLKENIIENPPVRSNLTSKKFKIYFKNDNGKIDVMKAEMSDSNIEALKTIKKIDREVRNR